MRNPDNCAALDRALLHELIHGAGVGVPNATGSTKSFFAGDEVYTKANCKRFNRTAVAEELAENEGPAHNPDSYTWWILEESDLPGVMDPRNYPPVHKGRDGQPRPNYILPDELELEAGK
mmetsp:Transcript_24377/g.76712  ORF Transcript_24377/g.76712 Transcript_24377/m.76712 type:complete len:120 (-) Transcript_24377:44-403(-)